MAELEPLVVDDLRIEASVQDGALRCMWTGKSTHRHPGKVLGPWFERALGNASDRDLGLAMHFEKLTHFNSSTIGAIVQLIQAARARGVKLKLVYSSGHRWQRLSFEALRVFDQDDALFSLETV